jgi:C-terminal processing protease CtpA/Prc
LRIIGGEEEKSQVSIGYIIPNSPAAIDGRLCLGDEIIKIDGHSTIRSSHEKVVQLMQRAKENQHVCLIVRRHTNPNNKTNSYRQINHDSYPTHQEDSHMKSPVDNQIRFVTLQKTNENQSFGFVIISSHNKADATVGKDDGFFLFSLYFIFIVYKQISIEKMYRNKWKIVMFTMFG